jgi:hypothetical protein
MLGVPRFEHIADSLPRRISGTVEEAEVRLAVKGRPAVTLDVIEEALSSHRSVTREPAVLEAASAAVNVDDPS